MVFHYILTMLVHSQQSSSVRATTLFWILTEFPQVRVRTPPFNLLNSLESIQGSSHTTCQLRISLARPVAKCSPGHSLRTCWCEIPLEILFEIPFDPTDLSPRFMKNWSNSLWLRVCCGWVGTWLISWNRWASSVRKQCHRYFCMFNSSMTML